MNTNVQIKGFIYQNGKYVKNPSHSGVKAVIKNSSTPRKVKKIRAKNKNSKKRR